MIIIKKNEIFVRDTLVGLEEISRRKHFICIVHSFITRTQLWLMLWNTIILIHTRGLNWQIISLLVDVRRKPAILFCGLPHVGRQRDQGYRIQADYNVLRLIVYISLWTIRITTYLSPSAYYTTTTVLVTDYLKVQPYCSRRKVEHYLIFLVRKSLKIGYHLKDR